MNFNILYHISKEDLNNKTLYPRVPVNELTSKGEENFRVKRVCLSIFIEGCLQSVPKVNLSDTFNIYIPRNEIKKQYIPTVNEVKDAKLTGEIWSLEPVTLKYYGKLIVAGRVDTAPSKGYWLDEKYIEVKQYIFRVIPEGTEDNNIILIKDELEKTSNFI